MSAATVISLNASVRVAWKRLIIAFQDRPTHHQFSFKLLGLAILKKFNPETRIYHTKFGKVMFIKKCRSIEQNMMSVHSKKNQNTPFFNSASFYFNLKTEILIYLPCPVKIRFQTLNGKF